MGLLSKAILNLTGKALTDRPPVAGGRGTILSVPGVVGAGTPLQFLQAYGTVGWLYVAVSRIAESVAKAHWRLVDEASDKEVERHPALDLWRRPNPFFSRYEFVETFQQHLELVGEAYWVVVSDSRGVPRELWPVRPDRIRPVPHPTEFVAGYEYRVGGAVLNLEPRDVVFLRRPNPLDPLRGAGPVQAILADLDAERYSAQWNRSFFLNSAEPGGIIESPDELSDADYERFILRWREGHQGVANAHRVAILEGGMKWQERKFTMRDMQFEKLRMVNRDIILGAFGIPKSIIGAIDDVNRASYEASMLMYSEQVVTPRLERIALALNERLLPLMGAEALEWEFDDPSPENRELALEEATRGFGGHVLTLNEARRRMGEPPADDGDKFAPWPVNMAPMALGLAGGVEVKALLPAERERLQRGMEESWAQRLRAESRRLVRFLGEAEEE